MRDETMIHESRSWFAVVVLAAATICVGRVNVFAGPGQLPGSAHTALLPIVAASRCSTDTTLCLGGGRFLVEATWTKPDAASGQAHAVPVTAETGYFWFFDAGNVEVAVKALDGCAFNGHTWVLIAGMTNLAVTVTVTDTATNQSKTYSNPQGAVFQTITDTAAFADCPSGVESPAVGSPIVTRRAAIAPRDGTPSCVGSDTVLCLSDRFQVEATWQTLSGESGVGHAMNLTTESGYFWFFDPSNVEVLVKALDACAIGSGQWFFAVGLTNVGVQLTVTDTFTGEVKTYGNTAGGTVPGDNFVPIQDTTSFSSCRTGPPQTYNVNIASQSNPCHLPEGGTSDNTSWTLSPSEIHIQAGDTVTWTQSTGTHALTSGVPGAPDGRWYLGYFIGPAGYFFQFTQSGTFPYYCVPGSAVYVVEQDGTCGTASVDYPVGTIIVDP